MASLSALILAAGKGVRMKSTLPKVMHHVWGRPMVDRVVSSVVQTGAKQIGVVVGHQAALVSDHLKKEFPKTRFFHQKVLNGSGGAVRQSLAWLKSQNGDVLVLCGDTPLLTSETLRRLIQAHKTEGNGATVLSAILPEPKGYGRIIRRADGSVVGIVEELDATEEQRKVQEINTGAYCFRASALARVLPKLKNNNAKKEFYLTDVLELMQMDGERVGAYISLDPSEAIGINSRLELVRAEGHLRRRKAESLMREGVTLMDPASIYIDEGVHIGPETVIWPQSFILGKSRIAGGCQIGPWTFIKDTIVEAKAIVRASFLESATVKKEAQIGPFSRVRPKSVVGEGAHLGNFSEVKNTVLGKGAKANHLSYLGDATVGKNVNIGAGVITCNYDGFQKYPTTIQDHAFVGSNVNLVAPVTIGAHAVVGAGSTLSDDVPAWALGLERAPLKIKTGWAKEQRKKKLSKNHRGRR